MQRYLGHTTRNSDLEIATFCQLILPFDFEDSVLCWEKVLSFYVLKSVILCLCEFCFLVSSSESPFLAQGNLK